jgi:hypothetical protein
MKPVRIWVGIVFLTLGVIAMLDATGALDWDTTVGEWWPVAIIGWGLSEAVQDRRMTFWDGVITAIGVALLADEQAWGAEAVVWGALFIGIGLLVLLSLGDPASDHDAGRRDAGRPDAKLRRRSTCVT